MKRVRPLSDRQIIFLLRVALGKVEWSVALGYITGRVRDSGYNHSIHTVDAMFRRGLILFPGRTEFNRRFRLTGDGERLVEGLRSSWPKLAEIADRE